MDLRFSRAPFRISFILQEAGCESHTVSHVFLDEVLGEIGEERVTLVFRQIFDVERKVQVIGHWILLFVFGAHLE